MSPPECFASILEDVMVEPVLPMKIFFDWL